MGHLQLVCARTQNSRFQILIPNLQIHICNFSFVSKPNPQKLKSLANLSLHICFYLCIQSHCVILTPIDIFLRAGYLIQKKVIKLPSPKQELHDVCVDHITVFSIAGTLPRRAKTLAVYLLLSRVYERYFLR